MDLESFLISLTGDEAKVKEAIKEIEKITEHYSYKKELDPIKIVWAIARLLPNKEEISGEFYCQPLVSGHSHPKPDGQPDEKHEPRDTKMGQWVGDSSRSAVWTNSKLRVDDEKSNTYKVKGKVVPWSPLCRGGTVPTLIIKEKSKELNNKVDALEFAKRFADDPYSPTFLLYEPYTTQDKEGLNEIQKEQLIASTSGDSEEERVGKIKHHRNVE